MFNKLYYFGILFTFFFTISAKSQSITIKGNVYDAKTNKPLPNANLFINELQKGTISNQLGIYNFHNIAGGSYTISCSFIGYKSCTKKIKITSNYSLDFYLIPKSILLDETIVKAGKANLRETPIAFSEINRNEINRELASQDVPHILQNRPSIYVSSQGGGTGDLRMNIRGFDQTHFAVMINGIPINNPENGEIYWSNWSGIGDVVENIQVQRGLTANPYSSNAVGGLVNIQTFGINSNNNFVKIHSEFGADKFIKNSIAFNKHLINNKISVTGLISKKNWNGYADQTYLSEYTYYFALGGIFGKHSLELQTIGSPQEHGQRLTKQKIKTWEIRGKNYNPDWGYLNGKPINLRDNKYHNPTINLNHVWQISKNTSMVNLFYYIPGRGGGTVPPWVDFDRTDAGLIDFDKEFKHNSNNIDSAYSNTLNKTENALRFFNHTHQWLGFLSTLKYSYFFSTFKFGIDFRYYKANNHQEVSNLLGGDYTIGWAGFNNKFQYPLFTGDKIDFDADSFAKHYGIFIQYEFNNKTISYYLNTTLSSVGYSRIDYFNYADNDPARETGWKLFTGYSIKGGVNFNLNNNNNIYCNIGNISKPPIAYNVFDYSNKIFKDVKNETVLSAEIGYGYNSNRFKVNINSFFTLWGNKSFNRTEQDWNTGQFFFLNITGANSKHIGIEFETNYKLFNTVSLFGMLSYSLNKFTKNATTAKFPEDNPTQVEYLTSYVKGIFLPNFPMLTASVAVEYNSKIGKLFSIFIKPLLVISANQYAQFDPSTRTNISEENKNSWELPTSYLLNLYTTINYNLPDMFIKSMSITFNIYNIINQKDYIIDALDGSEHNAASALVWYGRERWWNVGISFNF